MSEGLSEKLHGGHSLTLKKFWWWHFGGIVFFVFFCAWTNWSASIFHLSKRIEKKTTLYVIDERHSWYFLRYSRCARKEGISCPVTLFASLGHFYAQSPSSIVLSLSLSSFLLFHFYFFLFFFCVCVLFLFFF